jgi:hypothetical protein
MSAERYRRHAAECIRLSAATSDAGSRRAFHHMAMLWEALERQARRVDRAPAQQQQQPQPQPQPKDAKYPIRRPPSDPPRQTTNFSRPPACTLWIDRQEAADPELAEHIDNEAVGDTAPNSTRGSPRQARR